MMGLASGASDPVHQHGDSETFDVIIIGSGMGGLTCGSLLAQLRGRRVLVLEQHFRLGGFLHAFSRPGGSRWDTGLHYVGSMGEESPVRAVMDVVTRGEVQWNPLPSPFESYHFPGLTISQPVGRGAWLETLVRYWPEERVAIDRYFDRVEAAFNWFASAIKETSPLNRRAAVGSIERSRRIALTTTATTLEECGIRSPKLAAVLTAQWGDHGVPPRASAFVAHAMVVHHFLEGAWFPEGGAAGIAAAARAAIEAEGGRCLVRHDVREVLIERGRAVGVRVSCGPQRARVEREYRAPVIISNVGAANTYGRLIGDHAADLVELEREQVKDLQTSTGAVQLFLALRDSPKVIGARGENHWIFDGFDHDASYARRSRLVEGIATSAFVSFPSLNDPFATNHTAHVVAPADWSPFESWSGSGWMRRGGDYLELKERITNALLTLIEGHLPGMNALVENAELATPLTFQHFTRHRHGAVYGLPGVPDRFTAACTRVAAPIPGLFLTGADVGISGVAGAMIGGTMTVGHLLGIGGVDRVMAGVRQMAARL